MVDTTRTNENSSATSGVPVWNWTKEHVSYPRVVVEVDNADEVTAVLRDKDTYPSPVRGLASRHSTTRCGEADGGTIVDVQRLNRILRLGHDSVTAEAGTLYIDVAKELEQHDRQLYVNLELGNLSMGVGATGATKDGSMPGEYGQVNSYAIGMKIVTPSGEVVEIGEDDPDLLQAARSSYGLFGIITEATFRVRPLRAMAVHHEVFTLDEFARRLPELVAREQSMMLYILPFVDKIVVEFRVYLGDEADARTRSLPYRAGWKVRNFAWKTVAPTLGYAAERYVRPSSIRYAALDQFYRVIVPLMFTRLVRGGHTIPTDQMIRYPHVAGRSKYTFSIWGFAEDRYAETLREYFKWVKAYYRRTGWRTNLTDVGYRVAKDQSSLFSYTYDWNGITIDPCCTGAPGWTDFLDAYNVFCSEHDGKPLLNQTPQITHEHARQAFGDRLDRFEEYRRRFDPDDRLLNGYFRDLLHGSPS